MRWPPARDPALGRSRMEGDTPQVKAVVDAVRLGPSSGADLVTLEVGDVSLA